MTSLLIIFICSGLLVYWMARVFLLLRASNEVINVTLECDVWRWRKLLLD